MVSFLWTIGSDAKLCPTLRLMDCSTPDFPVLHRLPEIAQTHVIESLMPSNHLVLCRPFSSCPQSSPASGSFTVSQFFASGGQSIGASASVLPMNIRGWFPLGLTGLISVMSKGSKSLLQHHSSKAAFLQCSAFLMVQLSHLVHEYCKNHSLNYTDLCWQSDVSAF